MVCMPMCTQFVCACCEALTMCVYTQSMSVCRRSVRVRVSVYTFGLIHTPGWSSRPLF